MNKSITLLWFIAGYYGANDWEAAQIDMVVDGMEDIIKPVLAMLFNKSDEEKVTVVNADILHSYLNNISRYKNYSMSELQVMS